MWYDPLPRSGFSSHWTRNRPGNLDLLLTLLPREDHRDHTATDITAEGLHMEIKPDNYREPYHSKPLTETLTRSCTERSRNYHQTACQTDSQTTLPEAFQMTTKKPTDIPQKLPTEMATEKSTKNALKPKKDSLQMKPKPNRSTCQITERSRLHSF